MKHYGGAILETEILRELSAILYRHGPPEGLPKADAFEGLDIVEMVTSKRGVELSGKTWFLPNSIDYSLEIILRRPAFSSLSSVTLKKLRSALVLSCEYREGVVCLTIG